MSGGKQSATQYRILSPAGQQREGGGADMQVAALPARRDQIAALAHRAELAIGFKQLVSIRQDAAGVTPWRDHAVTPHIGEHDSPGGAFGPGLMGMMAAGVMETGPPTGPGGFGGGPPGFFGGYGGYGDYWATTPGSRRQPSTRRASPPRPGRQRPPGPVRSPRR